MSHHASKFVKCPYYTNNDNNKIKCEGLSKDSSLHLVFQDCLDRAKYMKEYCNSVFACRDCLLHIALNEKWGVDDEK